MTSLREGLGGEEITISGLADNAAYVSPYFVGSVTSESQISGANIYSTGAVQGENIVGDTSISGASIYANATIQGEDLVGDTSISGANIYSTGVLQGDQLVVAGSVTDSVGKLQSVALGSPSAFGASVQAGSATLGAGSSVAVVFGTAYSNEPHVVLSYRDVTSDNGVVTGSNVSTTGFSAIGDTASLAIDWISVGA